jgi:hypothetical protein
VWATDANGNYTESLIGSVSPTNTGLESLESIFGQDLNDDGVTGLYAAPGTTLEISNTLAGPSGATTIGMGAMLELAAADSSSVNFQGSTGTLRLDHSSTFAGTISNFRGNGSVSGSDQIDLRDIQYGSAHDSYANGVLTVSDGSGDSAKLSFSGSYTLANFELASDGSGGTIVHDPPALNAATANLSSAADGFHFDQAQFIARSAASLSGAHDDVPLSSAAHHVAPHALIT